MNLGIWQGRRFRIKFTCHAGHVTYGSAKLVSAVRSNFVGHTSERLAAVLEIEQDTCARGCKLVTATVVAPGRLSRSFRITMIRPEPSTAEPEHYALIDYTNHRGERRLRRIKPITIYFGSTDYHKEQWLLAAIDLDRDERRDFSLASIHEWRPVL